MFTLHSPKLQHYWSLTIRLFNIISRTLVGGGDISPLQRSSQCILRPKPTEQCTSWTVSIALWKKQNRNDIRMLCAVLNKFSCCTATFFPYHKQYEKDEQGLLGNAGGSKDEFINDVILWTNTLMLANKQKLTFIKLVWTLHAV